MSVWTVDEVLDRLSTACATACGAGYFPLAPGTFATVATIPLVLALRGGVSFEPLSSAALPPTPALVYPAVMVGLLMLGIVTSERVEKRLGKHDPSIVVIDEVVGYLVALAFLPATLLNLVVAFFLFRIFDIIKPLGIRAMQQFPGGTGIMIDDVLAGGLTNLVLRVLHLYLAWRAGGLSAGV